MAPRKHAASVFCALSVLGAAFLCFENLPTTGKQPSLISRVTHLATLGPRKSPTPRARFKNHNWTDDEFADLRRGQSRSSAVEIRKSFASSASAVNFTWINPGPVNPRVQIGGQYTGVSGKLQAIALDPSNPKLMYAGGGTGSGNEGPATEAGVFKSIDGGSSWTAANQGLLDTSVDVLWVDTSNPSVLLAGTEFGGLFRSTDAAATWAPVLSDASVSAIVSVTGGIIAGTAAGFEFSSNDGVTWTLLQHTASGVRCLAVNGSDIIAGLDGGDVLWKTPSDTTWRTVASNPNLTIWDIAIDPVDPTVAYYARGYGGTPNAVFRTMDRGASWHNIKAPTSTNGGFTQTIAVRASDRAILVSGQSMLYESRDFGSTWEQLNCPWDSRKIFVLPASSSMVMGSDHGLHWSDDGGKTWRDLTPTISANILYSVAVSGQTILTSSQDFGPFVSRDGGKTWTSPSGPLAEGGGVAINPADHTHCYAFTNANFSVSVDGCQSFKAVAGPTWENYVPASNQNLIAIDPRNSSNVYVGAFDGAWFSSDWGLTFTHLNWPITQISEIVFDPESSGVIYVCSTSGFYKSMSGGSDWSKLTLPSSSPPYAAAVSPTNSSVVLIALNDGAGRPQGGVLRSTDGGLTFNFANQGLSTANFNLGADQQSIAFNPAPPPGTVPVVALATTGGIYASVDLGSTWQNIGANATPHVFSYVHWDRGYLWASTFGQGVLRSDQPVSSITLSPALEVTGGPIQFTNVIGSGTSSGSQTLQVITVRGAEKFTVSTAQSSGSCGNWLSVSPSSGITTGTTTGSPVRVSYIVAGLPPGTYATCNGTVIVVSGENTVTIPVTLRILQLSQSGLEDWNLSFESPLDLNSVNMVFDSRRQVIVMFGGRANSTVSSNTYQYTDTGWNQLATPHSPPGRYWSGMAYDDHRQRVVLFGGKNNSTTFGDTWEFDGSDWTSVSTVHSPGAQSAITMTYDSCRQKSVLLDLQGRTWEYDGSDWTNVPTAVSPQARNLAAMVFDAGHCRAVLFGGVGSPNGFADTWSYDGTTWTQFNSTTSPPGRWAHAMAFDTSRARIILFGGFVSAYGADTNETWEFDGATWAKILPQHSPSAIEQAGMVYDQNRARIVMFRPGEAWEYRPGPFWALATTHPWTFFRGQTGASYTVTLANTIWTDQASGIVTVRETTPPGLALVSMSGTGWDCTHGAPTCTRADPLAAGATYPPITVTVNVAADAPPWVTNSVTVSGGGLATATATDLTNIAAVAPIEPQISSGGIVNAATSQSGAIAPNEFISMKGTGLGPATGVASAMTTELEGTRVLIGGTPAYLTYAQGGQINVLVPFNVSGLQNTTIQVQYNGVAGNTVTVPVVPSSPGIFTQQYGPGQAWIVNQNGTFNSSSNPAARNSYVSFWVTGQGVVNPPIPDGTQPSRPPYPTPMLPVSVSIGGVKVPTANIAFDGLVYSGEIQINLLIPNKAPTGSALPLVVTIGSASSRSDATIAIQ